MTDAVHEGGSAREDVTLDPTGAGAHGDPAWQQYLELCSEYLKRQLIVYENWPQRRFSALGYSEERVFRDQNA